MSVGISGGIVAIADISGANVSISGGNLDTAIWLWQASSLSWVSALADASGNLLTAGAGGGGGGSVTQGTVPWADNITQFGGANIVTGTGVGGAGIPRVTVSSDSFPASQPVSGTVGVSNFPATQPVSAAALPLPAGAATAALQTTINTTLGSPLQAGGAVSVSNFPATQPVSGAVSVSNLPAVQVVSGTIAVAPQPIPTVVQNDDRQYDDDGVPYVNPNVPGADIATGDKQNQILAAIQAPQPRNIVGTIVAAVTGAVSNTPLVLAPNASQEVAGNLQRIADLMEAVLAELRVHSICMAQLSQPQIESLEALRTDLNVVN